jgi:hypothetical protein
VGRYKLALSAALKGEELSKEGFGSIAAEEQGGSARLPQQAQGVLTREEKRRERLVGA